MLHLYLGTIFEVSYIFPVQFELTVFNYIKAVMEDESAALPPLQIHLMSTGYVTTLKGQDARRIPTADLRQYSNQHFSFEPRKLYKPL